MVAGNDSGDGHAADGPLTGADLEEGPAEIETDPLYERVCAAGASMVRIDRADRPEDGKRSIWHQGNELSELTSWETSDSTLISQELSFLGMAVVYRRDNGLRTGTVVEVEDTSDPEMPTADQINFDAAPSLRSLQLAAQLLREAKRDYYIQHMLGMVNEALIKRFNRPQTEVHGLNRWKNRVRRASDKVRKLRLRRLQITLYVGIGMAIGALVTAALIALS